MARASKSVVDVSVEGETNALGVTGVEEVRIPELPHRGNDSGGPRSRVRARHAEEGAWGASGSAAKKGLAQGTHPAAKEPRGEAMPTGMWMRLWPGAAPVVVTVRVTAATRRVSREISPPSATLL